MFHTTGAYETILGGGNPEQGGQEKSVSGAQSRCAHTRESKQRSAGDKPGVWQETTGLFRGLWKMPRA